LDADITKEHLEEKFSSFGKIISLAIAKDGNGLSKGFGFVNYDNPDDARRAIEAMNGSKFGNLFIFLVVGLWCTKLHFPGCLILWNISWF
jgi:polyadenylate-binding protein